MRSRFLSRPRRRTLRWSLPFRESSLPSSLPRFISIFLRAFCVQFHLASLGSHPLSFSRLSLCHSWRVDESARSLAPPLPSPSPHPSSSTLVSFSFHLPLFFSLALLVPRPFRRFFLETLLVSPSLSFSARWLHLLVPSFPPHEAKTLFSRGPFSSTVSATLLSFSPLSLSPLPSYPLLRSLSPSLRLSLFPPHQPLRFLARWEASTLLSFSSLPLLILHAAFPFPPGRCAFYVFPTLSTFFLGSSRTFSFRRRRRRRGTIVPPSSSRRPTSSFSGKT